MFEAKMTADQSTSLFRAIEALGPAGSIMEEMDLLEIDLTEVPASLMAKVLVRQKKINVFSLLTVDQWSLLFREMVAVKTPVVEAMDLYWEDLDGVPMELAHKALARVQVIGIKEARLDKERWSSMVKQIEAVQPPVVRELEMV